MYTKYVGCLLACSLAAASSAAMEEVYYAGVNIALVDYEIDTIADSGSLGLAYLRVGTEILPNFSAELRAGYGISDDTIAGLERDAQVRGLFGLYLRGGVSLTVNLTP